MNSYHLIPGFPASMSPSSHATEAEGFVFLTGQFGRDIDNPDAPLPEGIAAQTEQTMRNMTRTLNALGLDLSDVLSVRVFLTHFERDYEQMNAAYRPFFSDDRRPTRTCVGVTALVRSALVEIDCVAHRALRTQRRPLDEGGQAFESL